MEGRPDTDLTMEFVRGKLVDEVARSRPSSGLESALRTKFKKKPEQQMYHRERWISCGHDDRTKRTELRNWLRIIPDELMPNDEEMKSPMSASQMNKLEALFLKQIKNFSIPTTQ